MPYHSLEAADFELKHVPVYDIRTPHAKRTSNQITRVTESVNHFFPTHPKPFAATAIFSAIRPAHRALLKLSANARATFRPSDRRSAARLAVARAVRSDQTERVTSGIITQITADGGDDAPE